MNIQEQIKNSNCLDQEEKGYWIDLLPIMNESQIDRLSDILRTESEKLKELNEKVLTNFGKNVELES